ncbi:uncharacterized protein V1510DRAFT_396974 [Dipodascopsis tothii]|uniref:uncharacterized protein n=1 Tax=Dipodascopsis tothii TaxID=44089 RepID=UPI0034CF3B6D
MFPAVRFTLTSDNAAAFLQMVFALLASVIGIARLVIESGAAMNAAALINFHATTSLSIVAAARHDPVTDFGAAPAPFEPRSAGPTVVTIRNKTLRLSLIGGSLDTSISASLQHFSEIPLDPALHDEHKSKFIQYGGLLVAYSPIRMKFENCSIVLVNHEDLPREPAMVARPQTELARTFELTSSAILLIPPKYRCKILKSEKFSAWDTAVLAWRIRGERAKLWSILHEIESELKIQEEPHSFMGNITSLPALRSYASLSLLAKHNINIDLDGSTLDLQRAVLAARSIRTVCV